MEGVKAMKLYYPVAIHKDEHSDYGVTVPDIPGCFSAGATLEEALREVKEAIECHLEGLLLDGEDIPSPTRDYAHLIKRSEYEDGIWHLVEIDTGKLDTKTRRINITIPEHILTRVDRYVKQRHGNRSGFLAQAAEAFIEQQEGGA
jgi:predicted RNase H-like HicB family nuclease